MVCQPWRLSATSLLSGCLQEQEPQQEPGQELQPEQKPQPVTRIPQQEQEPQQVGRALSFALPQPQRPPQRVAQGSLPHGRRPAQDCSR